MIQLIAIGGSGDAYLICALIEAFKRYHGRSDVEVVLRGKYGCIAQMFAGVAWRADDLLVDGAERDLALQLRYHNDLFSGRPFYAHPSFINSGARLDQLTIKPNTSQADMYRAMLRLPHDASMSLPTLPSVGQIPGGVLLITEAVSWPNSPLSFWTALGAMLAAAGWRVGVNDKGWPLAELLQRCQSSEWVIGPQCGVMSILCAGRFACRKTIIAQSVDGAPPPGFLPYTTYPYGYATKFAGEDYDLDEHKVCAGNHDQVIEAVTTSANSLRLRAHDPRPVTTLYAPVMPGEALDRLAVLTVKHTKFDPARRAAIEREYQRYRELVRELLEQPEASKVFARMLSIHSQTYDLLERLIPDGGDVDEYKAANALNRTRVALRCEADSLCRAPYTEHKSYYDPVPIPHPHQTAHVNINGHQPQFVETVNRINLVTYDGRFWAIPQSLGPVQIERAEWRSHSLIRSYGKIEEARAACR